MNNFENYANIEQSVIQWLIHMYWGLGVKVVIYLPYLSKNCVPTVT